MDTEHFNNGPTYKDDFDAERNTEMSALDSDEDNEEIAGKSGPERQTWAGQADFVISAVGCAVGLGNLWRFPYLCYKNGGGAFLLPYFISLICVGAPVLIMEVALGQYMSAGVIRAWNIAPAFRGIGLASQVVLTLLNLYYIVVLSWTIYYLASSFTASLPWATCGNSWNTPRCFVSGMNTTRAADNYTSPLVISRDNQTDIAYWNTTMSNAVGNVMAHSEGVSKAKDAVVEFWERGVLQMSSGIDEPGKLVWGLAVSLFVAWLLVFICVCRGVRWTGKIVYFTALFPYVLLIALFIRGVTLDGATDGLIYYLKPDFVKIADSQVWISAFTQVLFSICITFGFMITLGSYNKFKFDCIRNSIIITCVNSGTSLFGGLVVFSVLGFMAKEQNVSIEDVAESGPGLVFIAYPKAITQMPLSSVWAVLFFFTIILIGLDSQFCAVEGLLTPLIDSFPKTLYKTKNRMIVVAVYCFVCYIIGLSMVSRGGIYIFQLFDYYSCSGFVLLYICLFEVITVSWVFGADRFYDAIELMVGRRLNLWLKICWKFIVPALSFGMFIFQLVQFQPLVYNKIYNYPVWAHVFGFSMGITAMLCIPIYFCFALSRKQGSLKQRWRAAATPYLKPHQVHLRWKELDLPWDRNTSS